MGRYGGTVQQPLKMQKNSRTKALFRSQMVDNLYLSRLKELAMARFKWENLPDEIDERFLEMTLNEYGMMAFFKDDIANQFVCLPAMINGDFNIYMNPNNLRAWAVNGYNRDLSFQNSVPIYNNMLRNATWPWLVYYAEQLYDIDQTRMINIKAQKTPILLKGNDKQRLTLKNIYLDYDGNAPVIMVDESLDGKEMQVLKTDAPFIASDLTAIRRQIFGEAMIYLGYHTQEPTQKQERVLKGELEASQSESSSSRYSPLICRRQACEKINKMFGLDISVNFRQDISTIFEFDDPIEQYVNSDPQIMSKGGTVNNEPLHNPVENAIK